MLNFKRSDTVRIGERNVRVRKITIEKWEELFNSIQILPQMIISVISAPAADRIGFLVVALRETFDEVVRITALLTDLDEEYIRKNGALDELVEFYAATVKVNNFGELLKNGQSVLGKVIPKIPAMSQDAT
ncbi:hypothetical protein MH117_09670 [Paenibacillus sp. ACRRX]|uniref:hypothetical protein n=1 Tax=Paenibacillus sp. ACRRX TaxID=2918206 RepID=UPI001EF6D9B5|nr:hypothetical protein [Paenibacillus sp. ACRRX]MCG7407691.1 hypothetical protein [Paenibacillus sp. ACRRX]